MLNEIRIIFLSKLIILSFFVLSSREVLAATDGTLLFNPASVSVTAGQSVNLVARVDPGTNNVTVAELDITFVSSILRLDSITRSSAFDTTLAAANVNNTNGTGSIDVGSLSGPITETSDVATFSFTALATATNSLVSFANTSDAAADGEYIVATRTGTQVTVTSSGSADSTAPTIAAFVIPTSSTSFTVPITTFTATDNVEVIGYKLTLTSSAPTAESSGWTSSVPTSYYFNNAGLNTLYAWAKDAAGNVSASLSDSVVITISDSVEEDISPPSIYNGVPTGNLSSDTTSVELSVLTDGASICRYSTTENIAYDQMTLAFSSTSGTSHFQRISDLDDDKTYKYYVRCKDENENVNTSDYLVTFSIKEKSSSKDEDGNEEKPKRKINNSKSSIRRGETLVQSGKRFSKNANVLLYFSKSDGGYYAPKKVKTSSSGKFSLSYRVNKSAGKYNWYAVDVNSGRKSKTKSYTVR